MGKPKGSLCQQYPRHLEVPILVSLSFTFLLTGLSLPLITVEKTVFFRHWENHYSVFTGIVELAKHGDYFLSVVIFFFSMVFPFAKLLTLMGIWYKSLSDRRRKVALNWLGTLGKWSMLDVFAVAILVVAAKLKALTEVQPQRGVYFFGCAIILSMLTTMWVDRLAKNPSTLKSDP